MLPTKTSSFVVRSAKRFIASQTTKESAVATKKLTNIPLNPGKKVLALASICTLTGIAIGSLNPESKEPGITSNVKEILGLYLQKMGKSLSNEQPPAKVIEKDPNKIELQNTAPPDVPTNSPTMLSILYNSPTAQAIGYGALGAALTCGGVPGAPIFFGLMGSKILESTGGYDYLKNQSFVALGITDDTKTKKP